MRVSALVVLLLAVTPALAHATTGDASVALVLGALVLVLVVAKVCGRVAEALAQPAVLGELLGGIVLGNVSLLGWTGLEPIEHDPGITLLAELGVVVLLFEVGLESTVAEMRKVGLSATLVAVLGVVAPFVLGWGVGAAALPDASPYVHVFLGATLTATSVGITARVLKDLGRSSSREAKVILGAAVVDDVLGLIVLAVVAGLITAASDGGQLSLLGVAAIVVKALGFLVGALVVGSVVTRRWFRLALRLETTNVLLPASLAVCFAFAWLASELGLAPIVGAFAAGLLLEPVHYRDLETRERHELAHLLEPIAGLLVPVFFVVMGMRVDLRALADPALAGLALALTAAAIAGKQVCSLGVLERGLDRLSVGIGMVPRGEVGLIFASVGLGLRLDGHAIIEPATYGAVVVMVLVTTLVTPPALRWSLARRR
jgi:Kef-type K+ transport system membrane component KefB